MIRRITNTRHSSCGRLPAILVLLSIVITSHSTTAFTSTTTTTPRIFQRQSLQQQHHSHAKQQPQHRTPTSTTAQLMGVGPHEFSTIHDFISSHSFLLADAAEAVADEAKKDGGWWQSYLLLFKGALTFVHSQIDGPLRNAGFDQTWGVSIALFTFGVRSALLPLSIQQSKSAEYMKALKPYQDEIKEKFKDRQETQNRAIAKLYEDANQNPLSGCLFSLLQLPVFLGLYRSVTLLAKDGQLGEPFLWIPNLAGPVTPPTYRGMDWLTSGWQTIDGTLTPPLGWETTLCFLVMPAILVLIQSATMNVLSPKTDDMSESEKAEAEKAAGILKFLPLLIGYFSLQVPAGLTIYWLSSNLFTLTSSLSVRAYYKANPPKIELPDYWDALDDVAKMSPEERRKAAEAGINTGPKFEDLLDEAQFHYLVERQALRESSPAWDRVQKSVNGGDDVIPSALASWVAEDGDVSMTSTPVMEHKTTHVAEEMTTTDSEKEASLESSKV